MKKALCVLLCLLLGLSLTGCGRLLFFLLIALDDDRAPKDEIFAYVSEQEDLLLQCIESKDYSAVLQGSIVRDVNVRQNHVDFYCGGNSYYVEHICGHFYFYELAF